MFARLALGNVRKSLADFGIYFPHGHCWAWAVFYAFNSMTAQQGVLAFSETQKQDVRSAGHGHRRRVGVHCVHARVPRGVREQFPHQRRKREFRVYLALGMSIGRGEDRGAGIR